MVIPQFPEGHSIGKQVHYKLGGASYHGNIRPERGFIENADTVGTNITIHENGLLISDNISQVLHEIHSSHILDLESTGRNETVENGHPGIGGTLLSLLAFLTLGIIALVFTHDNDRNNSGYTTRYVYYLSVKFWDINSNAERTILVSGSKFRIKKFVTKYNSLFKETNLPQSRD